MDECQTPAVDGLHAVLAQRHLGGEERHVLHVAAQVKIESNIESGWSHVNFKRLVPGAFNVGLIASTCTASPCPQTVRTARRCTPRCPPRRCTRAGTRRRTLRRRTPWIRASHTLLATSYDAMLNHEMSAQSGLDDAAGNQYLPGSSLRHSLWRSADLGGRVPDSGYDWQALPWRGWRSPCPP